MKHLKEIRRLVKRHYWRWFGQRVNPTDEEVVAEVEMLRKRDERGDLDDNLLDYFCSIAPYLD